MNSGGFFAPRPNGTPQLLRKDMMMPFRQRVIAGYKKMLVQAKKDFKRDNRLLHSAQADSIGRTSLKLALKDHKNRIKMCEREIANLEREG